MGQRLYEGMSLREVTEFLFLEDAPQPADLILVLGGKHKERAEKAAELYQQGLAPRILIVGGDARATQVPEAEALRQHCVALGVPDEAIWTETRSVRTLEHVLAATRIIAERLGWDRVRRILCVSAPAHMRRVKRVLTRHVPEGVEILCCPDGRQDVNRDNWWTTEKGRREVLRELEKVRTYALQGEL